jgi:hypothetical protein
MTSTDRNDLMPAQEKLEWVTPKITLMGAGDTEGKFLPFFSETITLTAGGGPTGIGPS